MTIGAPPSQLLPEDIVLEEYEDEMLIHQSLSFSNIDEDGRDQHGEEERMEVPMGICKNPYNGNQILLQEIEMIKERSGFDERQFRERCQRLQKGLCERFKEIVDELYDEMDKVVQELSKQLYQIQNDHMRNFDVRLSRIRQNGIQASAIEESTKDFLTKLQNAFSNAFNSNAAISNKRE